MATATPPQKKKGCGCGCALWVLFVFVGLPAIAFGVLVVLAMLDPQASGPGPVASTTTGPRVSVTPSTAVTQAARMATAQLSPWAKRVDDPFAVGWCTPTSAERGRARYERITGGAARYLRGRVVLVHLRIEAPGATWTPEARARMELASAAVTKLYQREAARYGIRDLDVRTVPWPLQTSVTIPPLTPGERNMLSAETTRALEHAVRKGLKSAEARTLDGIAAGYKSQGYDSVAFIAYVPAMSSARSYARPIEERDGTAEVAFVFESDSVVQMATVAAHEGLHLFGADDLYQLAPADDGDANDIMSACRGFRGTGVGQATAWAIGWMRDPPARRYRF